VQYTCATVQYTCATVRYTCATVRYKGAFMWEHKGKMYIARSGGGRWSLTRDDVILSFKRTENWDFKRFKPKY
jgi:hypothetical protein